MRIIFYTCLAGLFICVNVSLSSCHAEGNEPANKNALSARAYYISNNGDDNNDGSRQHPWKNISKINNLTLHAGDSILLQGEQMFTGQLVLPSNTEGTAERPVVITSYSNGKATINAGNAKGIIIDKGNYIQLQNINVKGAGRKEGNVSDGISLTHCNNITVDGLDVSGFQKSGLLFRNCSNAILQNIFAHDNGYAGITVDGENNSKKDCRNIELRNCRAENNPGDLTNLNNHSGNGIVVSQCTNLKIAWCTATNNGWDMPRVGNGPVGIWAWEADSVVIEHCLSYRNRTSVGGGDGGGFDFDGGVTNSIIQYCLSYENEGSGIGLFEYNGASSWYNNTVRYNISINDGAVSPAKAGIFIWNNSYEHKLQNCAIYNNTVYNDKNAAISYEAESANEGFVFYNNIFVGNNSIITGNNTTGKYLGNCWWSLADGFNIKGVKSFEAWVNTTGQELLNEKVVGKNVNPGFTQLNDNKITDAKALSSFANAKAINPVLLKEGINLERQFGIITGGKDFNGNASPAQGIGASF